MEYINKTDFLKVVNNACTEDERKFIEALTKGYVETIDIVRCSECIHLERNIKKYTPNEPLTWICRGKGTDGFCSSGEIREKQPPIVTEEITELNEENSRLFKENEKLKNKLWEIEHIARGEVK